MLSTAKLLGWYGPVVITISSWAFVILTAISMGLLAVILLCVELHPNQSVLYFVQKGMIVRNPPAICVWFHCESAFSLPKFFIISTCEISLASQSSFPLFFFWELVCALIKLVPEKITQYLNVNCHTYLVACLTLSIYSKASLKIPMPHNFIILKSYLVAFGCWSLSILIHVSFFDKTFSTHWQYSLVILMVS